MKYLVTKLTSQLIVIAFALAVTITATASEHGLPRIDALSVSTLNRSGRLLIFGSGFGDAQDQSTVKIGHQSAIITTWTSTEIHAYVPENAAIGSASVQVISGKVASNEVPFNITMRASTDARADAHIRWSFQMDSSFPGRYVAIAPDGTIYASDISRLYALSPDGGLLWVAGAAGARRPISLDADGTIYTASNLVKALNPDGTVKWSFPNPHPGASLIAGPNVGTDGNIYAVHNTWSGGIGTFSLDPSGNLLWSDTLHSSSQGEADSNAEIVFGADQAFVGTAPSNNTYETKTVRFDGNEIWYGGAVNGLDLSAWYRPKLDPTGRLISSKWSLSIQAIAPDGSVDWISLNPHGNSMVMPGIDPVTGVIYTSSLGPKLWAINPNGSTRWTKVSSGETSRVTGLNVSPDGSMILTNGEIGFGGPGLLLAFNTIDGTFLWRVDLLPNAGGEQFVWTVQPTFTSNSQTAYITTGFLSNPGFSTVKAIRISDIVQPIPGDVNGDGIVNIQDILTLLNGWGACTGCSADLNSDGVVDVVDLLIVIANWG